MASRSFQRSLPWAIGLALLTVVSAVVTRLLFSASDGVVAISCMPSTIFLWMWLLFASYLTDYAAVLLEDCRNDLNTSGGGWIVPDAAGWMEFRVRGKGARWFSFGFALIGLSAGLLGLIWPAFVACSGVDRFGAVVGTVSIVVVFSFAGVGFHGACASLGLACTVARRNWQQLILAHGDKQGGLSPLVRLADTAGLFVFSGALALPMGLRIARIGYELWNPVHAKSFGSDSAAATAPPHDLGYAIFAVAIVAIGIWALFVVGASVTGRIEVAHALARFRYRERASLARTSAESSSDRETTRKALDELEVGKLQLSGWLAGMRNLIVAAGALFAAFHAPEQLLKLFPASK